MLALTIYEAGLCSCGHPMVIAHDPDNDGWYDTHKVQCHSCAKRELATRGDGTNPYVPEPGEKVHTVFDADGKAAAALRRQASRPHN